MKLVVLTVLALLSSSTFAANLEVQAQHDLASPGGKQYEMAASQFSVSILNRIAPICVKGSSLSTFNVYLKLGSGGLVTASSVSPASPLAKCYAAQLSKSIWPKPPFTPFVFKIDLLGNSEEFAPQLCAQADLRGVSC